MCFLKKILKICEETKDPNVDCEELIVLLAELKGPG